MKQWLAEIAMETTSGPKRIKEAFFLPTQNDVRREVSKRGAYVLSIREYKRSPAERLLARSSWWQIQLLRGILFRSSSSSPGVALWKLIEVETNLMRQNILAPAREALAQGLGVIDALKTLRIFDQSTIAILAASEKANKLRDGIPHAIETITQKRKNTRVLKGTMAWLGIDVIMVTQALFVGKGYVIDMFMRNKPTDPVKLAEFENVVGNLELTWDALILIAVASGGLLVWCIVSFFLNRGKKDWPTAKFVRSIPLIGAYLRDLGFADSMSICARMIRGRVPIADALLQASEATSIPEIADYWEKSHGDLNRGVSLGQALDREPLTKNERMELAGLSDLAQLATIMDAISEMRAQSSKGKHSLIVWLAFALTAVFLVAAIGSAIYGLGVLNMGMDSMMGGLMGDAM
jgi:type II secretory pathway component PulF